MMRKTDTICRSPSRLPLMCRKASRWQTTMTIIPFGSTNSWTGAFKFKHVTAPYKEVCYNDIHNMENHRRFHCAALVVPSTSQLSRGNTNVIPVCTNIQVFVINHQFTHYHVSCNCGSPNTIFSP